GDIPTDFPTVHPAVCDTEESQAFLMMLDLTKPDPVDDVIGNILPKYRDHHTDVNDGAYESDIQRILKVFDTDSKVQREKLLAALRETPFVMAVGTQGGRKCISTPGDVYLATDRLKE